MPMIPADLEERLFALPDEIIDEKLILVEVGLIRAEHELLERYIQAIEAAIVIIDRVEGTFDLFTPADLRESVDAFRETVKKISTGVSGGEG